VFGLIPSVVKTFQGEIGGVISGFGIKALNGEINIKFIKDFTKNNGYLFFNINNFIASSITITGQTDIQ